MKNNTPQICEYLQPCAENEGEHFYCTGALLPDSDKCGLREAFKNDDRTENELLLG